MKAKQRIADYIAARRTMQQCGDQIHGIGDFKGGTKDLLVSDIQAVVESHDSLESLGRRMAEKYHDEHHARYEIEDQPKPLEFDKCRREFCGSFHQLAKIV